jgi:hypothetical protein
MKEIIRKLTHTCDGPALLPLRLALGAGFMAHGSSGHLGHGLQDFVEAKLVFWGMLAESFGGLLGLFTLWLNIAYGWRPRFTTAIFFPRMGITVVGEIRSRRRWKTTG